MRAYQEHGVKVLQGDARFEHVMALTLDPTSGNRRGLARCITSRHGDLSHQGYVDRSELHFVEGSSLERFSLGDQLRMQNEDEIIKNIADSAEWDFIGLEDPDIWVEEGATHVYFTLPFKHRARQKHTAIALGHAQGKDLRSLRMSEPVLLPFQLGGSGNGAKEVSIAPPASSGIRYNLLESSDSSFDDNASVVQVALAPELGSPWEYGEVMIHPFKQNLAWLGGHASPGPLLPRSFISLGGTKLLGILNGRERNRREGARVAYGKFSVGLFVYDYERAAVEWISPEPLIFDSQAHTITFASHFVETAPGIGILYAHVDDSFIRAYTLYAEGILPLLH